jgi:hypothetical protein
MSAVEWVKKNKVLTLILLIVVYFIYTLAKSIFGVSLRSFSVPESSTNKDVSLSAPSAFGSVQNSGMLLPNLSRSQDYAPQTDSQNRLVIQESNLSLLVKDVTDVRNKIVSYAASSGGYMVTSSVSNPQDAPIATVVIRVPSVKLEDTLNYLRSLSIKVVSENLIGKDVTDQYVDIDSHIATLLQTKVRYESILSETKEVSDIINLTQQIINTQTQIDSLNGQQLSLEKNAELAKLTVYLSTDEIALPYAPSETFRPAVIFKLAVRSMVGTLRGLGTLAIWIGVYSIIWVPALLIIRFIKKRSKNKAVPKV